MTWQIIYNSFKENPRDVKTNPQRNNAPRWFYVYAQGGDIFIDVARAHSNSSKINQCRKLDKCNFEKMLELNDKRNRGGSVKYEASKMWNQSYWYGIFRDIQERL